MELAHTTDQTPQPVFSTTPKPTPMRRINCYVDEAMHQEVAEIATYEGMELSATARELMSIGLRFYRFKRGTLNAALPQNNKTFYCQICGQLTKLRNMHTVIVMNDSYSFCEPCFFADKHKGFVCSQVQRS